MRRRPLLLQMARDTTTVQPWTYLKLQKTITSFTRAFHRQRNDVEIVWHYTNAAGLIGILESGYLRGTNYAFMNDASEFEYGCAVADDVLMELQKHHDDSNLFFSQISKDLRQFTQESEIYLACFSELGNDLSQWRGYSSGPDRFSLGVASAALKEPGAVMRAVEYRRSGQRSEIRRFLSRAWETVRRQRSAALECAAATMLVPFLFDILCFYKNARFASEREWRVAKRLSNAELADVAFSDSAAGLRAFVPLCGDPQRSPLPLKKLNYLSAHPARAEKFASMLLRKCGYLNVTVTQSSIPFVL